MDERELLAQRFEDNRSRLRPVAYRILGSLSEADDALQEAWLRLNRSDPAGIENLTAWLTTVVAHVCLDMLRSRSSRREESLAHPAVEPSAPLTSSYDPEEEALMADSVGVALLVLLDRLAPAERLAFVLHDVFAVPFEEIAPIVGRSTTAARQLASRARRRVQGVPAVPPGELSSQRKVVDSFLAAVRTGDFDGLIAVLDPDLVVHVDQANGVAGANPITIRGAEDFARQAITFRKGMRYVQSALVNGAVGAVLAPKGRLWRAMRFTVTNGRISGIEIITKSESVRQMELSLLGE